MHLLLGQPGSQPRMNIFNNTWGVGGGEKKVKRGRSVLCCEHRQNSSLIFKKRLPCAAVWSFSGGGGGGAARRFHFLFCSAHVNRAVEIRKLSGRDMTII